MEEERKNEPSEASPRRPRPRVRGPRGGRSIRARVTALILLLALPLSACGPAGAQAEDAAPPVDDVLQAILTAYGLSSDPTDEQRLDRQLNADGLDGYLTGIYHLPEGSCDDAAIYRSGGAEAFETAVLQLSADADADAVLAGLEQYLLDRQGDFTGYAPAQAEIVAQSSALLSNGGGYAALLICDRQDEVQAAFYRALDQSAGVSPAASPSPSIQPSADPAPAPASTPTPEPTPDPTAAPTIRPSAEPVTYPGRVSFVAPGIDDMTLFDSSAILTAWDSGDRSALSDKDAAILETAERVIDRVITDGMSDYEKEWAIYSWLTKTVEYDRDHYDSRLTVSPDSFTPYNPLKEHKGVCLGYATTFQLFMDLLDVECVTVVGAAFNSREDHAWNMVRLNGEWYCLDATWDNDSLGILALCSYFNVTSDYMAETDHQWDYANVPEATATDYGKP